MWEGLEVGGLEVGGGGDGVNEPWLSFLFLTEGRSGLEFPRKHSKGE